MHQDRAKEGYEDPPKEEKFKSEILATSQYKLQSKHLPKWLKFNYFNFIYF